MGAIFSQPSVVEAADVAILPGDDDFAIVSRRLNDPMPIAIEAKVAHVGRLDGRRTGEPLIDSLNAGAIRFRHALIEHDHLLVWLHREAASRSSLRLKSDGIRDLFPAIVNSRNKWRCTWTTTPTWQSM